MITLFAKDIQCNHCTMRINKALKEADIKANVSLENKTIEIKDEYKERTLEILDDLGFPAVEK